MKLPTWLRPRTATLEELRAQHDAALQAHSDALAAVPPAEQAFDDAGDDGAAKSLRAARETVAWASEHVRRAQRLIDDAEATRQAADRVALEKRRDALQEQLSRAAVQAAIAPLAKKKVELLVQIAEVDVSRAAMAAKYDDLERELTNALRTLGTPRLSGIVVGNDGVARSYSHEPVTGEVLSEFATIALLAERCEHLPAQHPLHAALDALRRSPFVDCLAVAS